MSDITVRYSDPYHRIIRDEVDVTDLDKNVHFT